MLKYEGYIKKQQLEVEQMRRLEARLLPEDTDYASITGLRLEAAEKLGKIRPRSVGQASRISGVISSGYFGALHLAGTPAKRRNRR